MDAGIAKAPPCQARPYVVYLITFLDYALLHVSRKSFSLIKARVTEEDFFWRGSQHVTRDQDLGMLDGLFLFVYAGGLLVSGLLGDRFSPRRLLVAGMVVSALLTMAFGGVGMAGVHSLWVYAGLWCLNGAVQSVAWPTTVKIMGQWFAKADRGSVLGTWSANASFGNALGAIVAIVILGRLSSAEGWQLTMIAAGGLLLVHAVFTAIWLVERPQDVGLPDPTAAHRRLLRQEHRRQQRSVNVSSSGAGSKRLAAEQANNKGGSSTGPSAPAALGSVDDSKRTQLLSGHSGNGREDAGAAVGVRPVQARITFWQAWCIPGVLPYALSYACLKSVNYGMFFWAPYYLKHRYSFSADRAAWFSMLYDAGQVLGGGLGGWWSDRLGSRAIPCVVMVLCSSALLYLLEQAEDLTSMGALLFAAGFMMGGPANLISSCIAADLGESVRNMNTPASSSSSSSSSQQPSGVGAANGDEDEDEGGALSTVTGLIDGTASLGAACAQYGIGWLSNCHKVVVKAGTTDTVCHWTPVFWLLVVGDIVSALFLLPTLVRDVRRLRRQASAGVDGMAMDDPAAACF